MLNGKGSGFAVVVFVSGLLLVIVGGLSLTKSDAQAAPAGSKEVDDRILLYTAEWNRWYLVDTTDGTIVTEIDAFSPEAAFSCDGSRVIANDGVGGLRIIDSITGETVAEHIFNEDGYSTELRDWSCAPAIAGNS